MCGAARDKMVGKCGVANEIKIAKYYLHRYEEPIISVKAAQGRCFFAVVRFNARSARTMK